ncbi:TPA: hypothetical protein RZA60_003311 [Vibrio vulnificus]|nr:hypothetical protein [Vibrio vulnificus]HDY7624947.1 hypothetical protein [Vibrio vulnificus]HEB2782942.1 hypothetical protein [Vibrio vulnificus]
MNNIDCKHLEKNILRFHKAATTLALKASGVKSEFELLHYPVFVAKGSVIEVYTCGEPDEDFFTAFIVNASFTLEMLLKAIIYYESGEWKSGHNLITLYQEVSTDSKRVINNRFKELCKLNGAYGRPLNQMQANVGTKIKLNMVEVLRASSTAFESWRYAFDTTRNNPSFVAYGEAYRALTERKESILNSNS